MFSLFRNLLRFSIAVPVSAAMLTVLAFSCGPKPEQKSLQKISGFIYVNELGGGLGSKALSRPGSLSLDAMGNLIICDAGNHRLVKVTPDGTFLAEIGGFGFSRDEFNSPTALATSDGINFYLLDSANDRVVRLNYDLNWISDFDLHASEDEHIFGHGSGIAINSFGDIYVSDPENNRVVRFNSDFGIVSELTELGGFLDPGAMAIDRNDNLYVINRDDRNIVVFDSYNNYKTTLAKDRLRDPSGLWVSRDNMLYVIDRKANSVIVFDHNGDEIYSFGSTGVGQYRFRGANSICVNREGWIFVSDMEGNRIVVYRPNKP